MPTNFLEYSGGTNGFLVAPFALMGTTDLASLASGANVTSTATVLTQATFGSAVFCRVLFQAAGAFTPAAGGFLAGWWLQSADGGTTFEKVVAAVDVPRNPDFTIPLYASAYASGDRSWANGLVKCPEGSAKAYIGNRSGITLGAFNHIITCCPIAIQY